MNAASASASSADFAASTGTPHTLPTIGADAAVIDALRQDLTDAGFTVERVDALWGNEAAASLHRGSRVAALRALAARDTTPLGILATLFVLGLPVRRADADAAFPSAGVQSVEASGLVRVGADSVTPAVDLRPYAFVDDLGAGSWWIVSDLGELALGTALGEEHVLGIGGATTTLSGLQVPVPVRRVLDLGTGCGIQAMHARRFADEVVATDISRRALDIARFNAQLNGIDGIEFRFGSLFEPVAGERFDRIVSNPPFVITPRSEGVPAYEYRDGGMVGDALVETVLTGLGEHLEPGGTAQLLGNWEYHWGTDGLDRVRSWFERADTDGLGLDAWVVERERQDPTAYAETWIRDGGTKPGTPEFDRLVGAWLDDFADRRVTGVGFGYVVVRKPRPGPTRAGSGASRSLRSDVAAEPVGRGAAHLRRFERVPETLGSNPAGLGATVARVLDAAAWLAAHDDVALAAAHLAVAGDVTEERFYWPGNDDPTVMTLVQGGGLGRRVDADTALAAFVGACDGELSVAAIVGALAQITGVDEQVLAADLLPAARDLVLDGLLVPAA
jgi:methylase of polypeptide subunit release factors